MSVGSFYHPHIPLYLWSHCRFMHFMGPSFRCHLLFDVGRSFPVLVPVEAVSKALPLFCVSLSVPPVSYLC